MKLCVKKHHVRSQVFDDGDVLERFAPTTLTLHKQDVIYHSPPLPPAFSPELAITLFTQTNSLLPVHWQNPHRPLAASSHLLIRKTCTCVLHSSIFCCGWFPSSSAADPEIHCIHYIFLVQEVNTGNRAGFLHLLLAICNMCHRICRFYDC